MSTANRVVLTPVHPILAACNPLAVLGNRFKRAFPRVDIRRQAGPVARRAPKLAFP